MECKNCLGDGIVGAGDQPWLKQGAQSTCAVCGGTGKIAEEVATEPVVEAPAEEVGEVPAEPSVDNPAVDAEPEPTV